MQIDERLCSEYPGMVRTITIFDGNEVGIEYDFQYSNEIGHRFEKVYETKEDLMSEIGLFIKNSERLELEDDNEIEKLALKSNLKLIKDTLSNKSFLPSGFKYKGSLDGLKKSYDIITQYLDNTPE